MLGIFANLTPFNLELPSWPGGRKPAPAINVDAGKEILASSGESMNMPPSYMNVPAYAAGGIITQPHLGLVGEAGREVIVPTEDRDSVLPMLMSG